MTKKSNKDQLTCLEKSLQKVESTIVIEEIMLF